MIVSEEIGDTDICFIQNNNADIKSNTNTDNAFDDGTVAGLKMANDKENKQLMSVSIVLMVFTFVFF